jgi:hypothetical protein
MTSMTMNGSMALRAEGCGCLRFIGLPREYGLAVAGIAGLTCGSGMDRTTPWKNCALDGLRDACR